MSQPVVTSQTLLSPYIHVWDIAGGPAVQLPIVVDTKGYYNVQGMNVDNSNIFQADALLASVPAVNLNTATETVLYKMPTGYSVCYITRVAIRLASTSLTTASWGYGWNAGTDTNVIASATHTELTGNTLVTILVPIAGQAVGAANGQFATKCTILQGGAATATMDVWGCLIA